MNMKIHWIDFEKYLRQTSIINFSEEILQNWKNNFFKNKIYTTEKAFKNTSLIFPDHVKESIITVLEDFKEWKSKMKQGPQDESPN